ncbi:PREDICTED: uncharacterized protein LOC108974979 [Bactrocera latifrons]|uniref:DUF4773 domain-containing protein n=1 Tax=Bactrocera latifrons TaxID=174628 RepID=A0A0K8V5K5_BACLA|nr:PREDICTED: uncharacterized protein LOC108974979 [Bactrocera latifrons]XP_018798700.1 PREDICTED: uncharacterized protein LOC108974979 [Bactrocera latifrons]
MRYQDILIGIVVACLMYFICVDAKTVFRRADKISSPFQRLNLPPEEIDPNVAPLEPQHIESLNSDDISGPGTDESTQFADEVVDQADEATAAAAAAAEANEIANEATNEIVDVVTIAPAVATPAVAAVASPATSSSASTAAVTEATTLQNTDDPSPISKYCKCTDDHCDCCRQFNLPLIPVRGPGCAKITYLGNERMSVAIKYGDITLATRTISGKRAKPICVGLPGGYSKFCGRVYGLSRAKNDFKACLGFELRAEDEVEAALRVSCFKFGPEGLRVAEAEPLPVEVNKEEDDDDIFGFGAGGDDDDDDDYDDEAEEADEEDDETDEDDDAEENDDDDTEAPADADYGGFSLAGLLDELDDDDEEKPAAAATPAAAVAPTSRIAERKDDAQGKEDNGAEAAEGHVESVAEDADVTPAPAAADGTTVKSKKKSKKERKQKKKKAASTGENDFAIEILNGILDFFN